MSGIVAPGFPSDLAEIIAIRPHLPRYTQATVLALVRVAG
jgi:hypothetical protein